jgi:hypothetical protein
VDRVQQAIEQAGADNGLSAASVVQIRSDGGGIANGPSESCHHIPACAFTPRRSRRSRAEKRHAPRSRLDAGVRIPRTSRHARGGAVRAAVPLQRIRPARGPAPAAAHTTCHGVRRVHLTCSLLILSQDGQATRGQAPRPVRAAVLSGLSSAGQRQNRALPHRPRPPFLLSCVQGATAVCGHATCNCNGMHHAPCTRQLPQAACSVDNAACGRLWSSPCARARRR